MVYLEQEDAGIFGGPQPSIYVKKEEEDDNGGGFREGPGMADAIPRSGAAPGGFPMNIQPSASYDSSGPQPYNAQQSYPPPGPMRPNAPRPLNVPPAGGFGGLQSPMQYSPNINNSIYPGNMPMQGSPQQQQQQQQQMPMPQSQGPMMPPQSAPATSAVPHPQGMQVPVSHSGQPAPVGIPVYHSGSSDASSVYNADAAHNNISGTPPAINNIMNAPRPPPAPQQQQQQREQQAQQQQQQPHSAAPSATGYYAPNSAGPEIPSTGYRQQFPPPSNSGSVIGNSYPPGSMPMRPMAGGFNGTNYVPSPGGYGPPPQSNYAPSMGPVPYGRPPYIPSMSSDDTTGTSRLNKAGKYALGALAAGAVAYGVHEFVDGGSSSDEEIRKQNRLRDERERQRRESEARRRREEEEIRRREEQERWRRNEEEKKRQEVYFQTPATSMHNGGGGGNFKPTYTPYGSVYAGSVTGRPRSESVSSRNSDGYRPPAPFGRLPYTYDQNDVRPADPSRGSENSSTPEVYPELRQKPSDTTIKIGTILALKHVATGRHLRSDRSHSTQSGSNQQLAFASKFTTGESDWWQVLPANHDVPIPGSIVAYGTQIRLRHVDTGRHLHSHYGFVDPLTGNNEVTCFGDQTLSDENDHWVIERFGDGGYGATAKATDTIVLRHYVSGMALHSQDTLLRDDQQPVSCFGPGGDDNDKWRIVLDS
ncbi:hypothetical protein GGI15_002645 [Coemansia interrupta]|uniref:MIR domain-containing protein n=1 Tax=Coemansia interrupta TaxID=1126814 RepID=A0A9W8LJP9_9FUNG|nr:hypothetical protein GGI15_002645 [Coemansia interrupta]